MDDQQIIHYGLRDLPASAVEYDENQPRKGLGEAPALHNLKRSIYRYGIQQPITVTEYEPGKYKIIDGHRRYACATKLGMETIPCLVYPKLDAGDMEARRYEMQNIRRPWKPLERSDALHRLKREFNFNSIKQLSEYIGISESSAADYLHLREQQLHLLSRMAEHNLNDSFQLEIVRLKPHLRKVAGLEVDHIIDSILKRIDDKKITNTKDIRIIKSVFIRFDLYEDILTTYLLDPDMLVKELEEQTLRTGYSWDIQKVVATLAQRRSRGQKLTEKESEALQQLIELAQEVL